MTGDQSSHPEHSTLPRLEGQLSISILGTSATMTGVCLTVIGLLRVFGKIATTQLDEFLAVTATGFLITIFCAYGALRTRSLARARQLERIADAIFLVSLVFIVLICGLISYELI